MRNAVADSRAYAANMHVELPFNYIADSYEKRQIFVNNPPIIHRARFNRGRSESTACVRACVRCLRAR